jgi:hypothetical protein
MRDVHYGDALCHATSKASNIDQTQIYTERDWNTVLRQGISRATTPDHKHLRHKLKSFLNVQLALAGMSQVYGLGNTSFWSVKTLTLQVPPSAEAENNASTQKFLSTGFEPLP